MTFEAVYKDQYAYVRKFCFRKLRNHADAEEITQEAFIHLLKGWSKVDRRNDCVGLLIQAAKWVMSHRAEANRRNKRRALLVPLDTVSAHYNFREPSSILEMVWKLPRLQRRAIVMHYYADMTFEEIGKAMGTGISTAEYRTKAGIKKLRTII